MRIPEIFLRCLDGVREVVDVTHAEIDLQAELRLPEGVSYRRQGASDLDVGPGGLVLALVGDGGPHQTDPDDLAQVLRGLTPGARAVLLLAWPVERLPSHRLLGPLVESGCQVVEAVPVTRLSVRGVPCALIVERVTKVVAPRPYLADLRNTSAIASEDELRTLLRMANEYVLGDLVARPLRRRVNELGDRVKELERRLAERDEQLRVSQRKLARAESRSAMLEASASFQVGRAVVQGVRHPARAVVTVPRDLARVWREKRAPKVPKQASPVTPRTTRRETTVAQIALPAVPGAPGQGVITLTAPGKLLVPRMLAETGLAGYEPDALACFLAAIDVAGPGAVMDIGANIGVYAALASAVTKRDVWAFEPTDSLAEVARKFAADNHLGFTTEALAIGAENGTATFYLSDKSDSSNSLAAGFRQSSGQVQVPVETLDSYVARTGAAPAVIKIDTETTEPDILIGGVKTITEHRPWILCEVLAGRVEDRLTEVLTPFDYHWYPINDEIPYQEADEIVGDKTYKHMMWLFAPERPSEDFWTALRARTAALAECTPARGAELSQP